MKNSTKGKGSAKKLVIFCGVLLAAALLVLMPLGAFAEGASSSGVQPATSVAASASSVDGSTASNSVLAVSGAESLAASGSEDGSAASVGSTDGSSVPDSSISDDSSMLEEEELEDRPLQSKPRARGIGPLSTGISIQDNKTPEELVEKLLGEGMSISNVAYVGTTASSGFFSDPSGILAGPGFEGDFSEGIVLGTGAVANYVGPNSQPGTGSNSGTGGDANLAALIGVSTDKLHDATVLEFDFVPQGNYLQFQYVFASEEYNYYAAPGQTFFDVFGFFLNGYDVSDNIALLPGTNTPVAVNTVNYHLNTEFYRNNDIHTLGATNDYFDTVPYVEVNVEFNGLTTVLTITAQVNRGVSNHIKLAIADCSDTAYDSGVFIGQMSSKPVVTVDDAPAQVNEDADEIEVTFVRDLGDKEAWTDFELGGTAQAGVHYQDISGTLHWEVGETSKTIKIPLLGGAMNGQDKNITVKLKNPVDANLGTPDSATIVIKAFPVVTYNANGGTGTVPVDSSNPYAPGSSVTVLGNTGNLSKAGYGFAGWNTKADGTGTTYQPGSTFVINSNTTLYAKWGGALTATFNSKGGSSVPTQTGLEPGNTVTQPANPTKSGLTFAGWYKETGCTNAWNFATDKMGSSSVTLYAKWTGQVTYNANGGTGTLPTDSTAYMEGSSVTTKPGTGLSKPGYKFVGWNTKADGSGTTIAAGSNFALSQDTTLYAVWQGDYTVTFNSQGGSAVASITGLVPNSTITKPANPTKAGLTFAGWYKEAACTNEWNFATDKVTGNITLYAKWTAKVTYNANGGSGAPTDATAYKEGSSVTTKPGTGVSRPGYKFTGWNTSADGSGTNVAANASFTITKDTTLYAVWAGDVTVSFNSNGGSAVASQTGLKPGDKATKPADPTKAGLTFAGWYKEAALTNAWNFTTDSVGSSNITLYAKWTAKVTYNANGGSGAPTDATAYKEGSTVTAKPGTGVSRPGYKFNGWNTKADGTGTNVAANGTFTLGSDTTLYAVWGGDVTVSFNSNGGSAVASQTGLKPGDKVTKPADPTKAGLTFAGWYKEAALTNAWNFTTDSVSSSNITLYAKWTAKVTYNANGGSGAPVDATAYKEGASVTVKAQGSMARAGYKFTGWSTTAGGAVTYAAGSTFNITKDTTLYAVWEGDVGVTFNSQGGSAVASQTGLKPNDTVTKPANPTKAGLTFAGWYKEAACTTEWNFTTDKMGTTSITLYAKWTAKVTYNANGGSGAPTDATAYKEGASVTAKPGTGVSRPGYKFNGWNTKADGTGTNVAANGTFTLGSDTTLYAVWGGDVTVSFNSNGGSAVASQTGLEPGDKVVKPADPTKTGLTFAGWYKEAALTNAWNFTTDSVGSSNITLYAKWTAKVAYDANGGNNAPVDATVYAEGSSVTVKAQGSMSRVGYKFKGWSTTSTGTVTHAANSTFNITKNTTLYAVWEGDVGVTFNSNGGSAVPGQNGLKPGDKVTKPANPTKPDLAFGGWYTDTTFTTEWNFTTDTLTGNSMTLYAKWTAKVTYNANGGSGAPTDATAYVEGSSVTVKPQGTTSRPGYKFTGWSTTAGGTVTHAAGSTFNITKDTTLYAVWEGNVGVTFNSQGGSAVASQTGLKPNDAVTKPANPTKTGLTFAGWYKEAACTTEWNFTTDKMGATSITLYAKWTAKVTYNANGGSGAPTDATAYKEGSSVTAKPGTGVSRPGYKFNGWNTKADGTGTNVAANGTFTLGSDTTLYAVWGGDVTVSFNSNGGSAVASQTGLEPGDKVVKPADPTKVDLTFAGWYKEAALTNAWNFSTDSVGSSNITLYAKWTAKVTYNANSGTGAPVDATVYAEGSSVTVKAQGSMARAGYKFKGWSTTPTGTVTHAANSTFNITKNTTLYAVWEGDVGVTFNSNGGSAVPGQNGLKPGDKVTKPADPTKPDLTFDGWYTNPTFTDEWNFTTDTLTSNSMTLYAKWTAKVTYDANGGNNAPVDATAYVENSNVTVKPQGTTSRAGYEFAGWSTSSTGSVTHTAGNSFKITKNTTLFAVWKGAVGVTFNSQGGSAVASQPGLKPNDAVTKPANPTKTGLTFAGWYKEAACTNEWNFATDKMGTTSITLYAKWTAKVTYNANGGSGAPADATAYKEGSSVIAKPQGAMSHSGYAFLGWSTNQAGPVNQPANATFTITKDTTLYAIWEGNVDVTFNSQGGSAVPSATKLVPGAKVPKPANPTKTGLTFAGWYKEAACTNEWNFTTDKVGATSFTLYAKWTAKLTYNANGGSGAPVDNKVYNEGQAAVVAAKGSMNRPGYKFMGWNTKADGTGTSPTIGGNISMNGNITLYAIWQGNVDVTFNSQGGSAVPSQLGRKPGDLVTKPADPTKANLSFAGWYKEASCVNAWNFATDKMGTTSITLYAKWTGDISFDSDGGSAVPPYNDVQEGSKIKEPAKPTKPGFDFDGWFKDPGLTNPWDFGNDKVTGDTTLHAKWTVHVNFDSQGGSSVAPITGITPGSTISAPANPTRLNYSFGGWYKEASYTTKWNFTTDTVNKNITLYAKWDMNYWSVTYKGPAGAEFIPNPSNKVAAGSTYQISENIPHLEGYDFTGWKSNPAASSYFFDYRDNDTFIMPDCPVVLEAVFVKSAPDDGSWSKNLPSSSNAGGNNPGGTGNTGNSSNNTGNTDPNTTGNGGTGNGNGQTPAGIITPSDDNTQNYNQSTASLSDNTAPLGPPNGGRGNSWSLINLIATVATAVFTIISLLLMGKRKRAAKLLWVPISAVLAVLAIIVLIFTSDFTTPMILVNIFTPLMLAILVIQVVVFILYTRKANQEEEEEEDTQEVLQYYS